MASDELSAGNFHLHNSFAFWLSRLNSALQEGFNQQLNRYQLTWPQWLVLNVLHHEIAHTPAQIAEQIAIDRSAVTRLLDRLEAKGFIVREHDKLDRRSVNIYLSPRGQHMMVEVNQAAHDYQHTFLANLHRSERRGLKGELQKILKTVGVDAQHLWQRVD